MSSLEAVRADGYYYGPDYDPRQHGSLNQYRGSHPLGDRAKKLDVGILVIRFEMPFKVWCTACSHVIDKGVRFNAEKKCVGTYFSTKILEFAFACPRCKEEITITTDPKNAEYRCTKGVRRKVETFSCEDAETIELPGIDEREKMNLDPMFRLDVKKAHTRTDQAEMETVIEDLIDFSDSRSADDYAANLALRERLRFRRLADENQAAAERALGPARAAAACAVGGEAEDALAAKSVRFRQRKTQMDRLVKKTAMKMTSIFDRKNVVPNKFSSASLQGKAVEAGFTLGPTITRISSKKDDKVHAHGAGARKRIPGTELGGVVVKKNKT
ncbi:nuclear protein-like family protein [Besnoitia besnoiti]|uniref:Nuclear protein-like family protein n=1 Tax=Besnoitia besnoiti TaxID=94643 RepID=A0A2A9MG41_BESBE|nr:nuclear protein-like family protein [Besnoitia besnoiti]PFH34332.1 nuclear protein-like family protein [Besnoitia besnoiti]